MNYTDAKEVACLSLAALGEVSDVKVQFYASGDVMLKQGEEFVYFDSEQFALLRKFMAGMDQC